MPRSRIAFVVMIGIGLIEAIGLGVGHLDLHADLDADVDGPALLDWLGLGSRLPILIWLTSLLACFTLAGVAMQQIATAWSSARRCTGAIAAGGALVVGGVLNGFVAAGLRTDHADLRIHRDLQRRADHAAAGRCWRALPGAAIPPGPRSSISIGQVHYVMVEPHNDDDVVAQGETGLARPQGRHALLRPAGRQHQPLRPICNHSGAYQQEAVLTASSDEHPHLRRHRAGGASWSSASSSPGSIAARPRTSR